MPTRSVDYKALAEQLQARAIELEHQVDEARHLAETIEARNAELLRTVAIAEDARQEVLFRAASRIRSFDQRSSFRTWIFVIARNVVLNEIRSRGRTPVPTGAVEAAADVAAADRDADTRLDVDAALARLSAARREVIVLRYLCDLPYQEIADILGIPVNTVRTRLRRALGDLRVIIGNSSGLAGVEG